MDKKHRPGIRASEFPQTPLILSQRKSKKVHILVGNDATQERFMEQYTGLTCDFRDKLADEDVIGKEALYKVDSPRNLDLSPKVREGADIWSLDPIIKGTAGASALVRYAAQTMGIEKPVRAQLELVAEAITKEEIEDIRASIWHAAWLLVGPPLENIKFWKDPWEDANGWLPSDVDPGYRLNTLYWHLFGFVYTIKDEEGAVRKAGAQISPARLKKLKSLKLDINRVHETYFELSRWRNLKYDPYICALRIRNIWQTQ